MLKILKKGERINKIDLAKKLNVTPRQIYKYKILLEQLGYTIDSKAGNKNNGYMLIFEKLTAEEKQEIQKKMDNEELFLKILRIIERV
jgi:predicted DNA-binding transcriptional regulator YafY